MRKNNLKFTAIKSLVLVILLIGTISLQSGAQTTITGTVRDSDGAPVPGATVIPKENPQHGTLTQADGTYFVDVPEGVETLVFSFIGMDTKTVAINGQTTINVVLQNSDIGIEEVIVTAYGVRRVTKSVSYAISNRTAGVRIRGNSSTRRNNVNYGVGKKIKKNKNKNNKTNNYTTTADKIEIEHNTEEYDVINENKFKTVKGNPLSTFSVDVDRASYANTRRFLNQNQLPQKDVVRIEELINYFHYDYPQPSGVDPFTTNLEMGTCPWNKEHYLINIGIQGKNIPVEELPASNLVFLLDVSGSMSSENKLPLLKQAFKILIQNLREEDRVAIVVYAGAAGLILPSTSGKEQDKIIAALNKLTAGGSTAGGAGIDLAYKIAKENFIESGNNRIILATDGDFNVGQSSDARLVRTIKEKRKDNIFLTILGFGMGNYKDAKMEQLSNAGNGNYAYIDNVLEAKKTLSNEIWGTLFTIAKDVKIQIEFNPAKVKAYRLIGYENRMLAAEDFNNDKKDAGEIGAGHTVTAIYETIPASSKETISDIDDLEYQDTKIKKSDNLMTLKLRYKKHDGKVSKLIVNRIKSNNIKTRNFSNNFTFSASVAQFGMILRDSEFKGEATFENTLALAKLSKGNDNEGYRAEFIKLIEIAEVLSK